MYTYIDIDINEFYKHIKLSIQNERYKVNTVYKKFKIQIFLLGKLYNKDHKKFRFKSKNIVYSFKSQCRNDSA